MPLAAGSQSGQTLTANVRAQLPIDELLGPLVQALESSRAVVVEAPPGAGKTTRIPRALLEAGLATDGEIWVTEPRRVAARLAASRVASEMGCALGGLVGYSVRHEERTSAETRLRYVTEGVLTRRLVAGTATAAPAIVVLDEFHERHLDTDLNLLLLKRRLQRDPRLRLVVMSATLDGARISRYLDDCPRLACEGRLFPLRVTYENGKDDRPLELRVSSAVKQLLGEAPSGDVLVFLPGSREIAKAEQSLRSFAERTGVQLVMLHGEMPLEAQARAITAGTGRKVVLSTNVAESSITVEGVTAVVDCGLARIATHSPWTGRQGLEVRPISQASAVQRAGRAGRTQPGQVLRLYSEADFRARPAHDKPEVQRLDLSGLLLTLFGAGISPGPLDWLDAPSDAAVDGARLLLERLGLLADGRLSSLGERALRLPLGPRLARVALEGQQLGISDTACRAAALLDERDIRLAPAGREHPDLLGTDCDVDQLIQLYSLAEAGRFSQATLRQLGLHPGRVAGVRQSYQQIRAALRGGRGSERADTDSPEPSTRELSLSLLAGFPDRVARRRKPGTRDLILSSGQVAQLSEHSLVRTPSLLLGVDAEDQSQAPLRGAARTPARGIVVRLAAPLDADWLLDHAASGLSEHEELEWDSARERVVVRSQLCWGAVVLEQSERAATASPEAAVLVEKAALAQRASIPAWSDSVQSLVVRCELLATHLPDHGFDRVSQLDPTSLLSRACNRVTSLPELRELDFRELFLAELEPAQRAALERETPEWIVLKGGRRVRVQYAAGQSPWLASRLQDFFGMREGPKLVGGRVAITLHLLAPNQRAVQVTSDLAGFWERHYSSVRRELARRYPRHAWPEDGRTP